MSCKERRSAMKKHILAPLIALTLLAPLAAGAEEMDEDRIKALVYEAIRENPGIVMEAVRLLEEQQQLLLMCEPYLAFPFWVLVVLYVRLTQILKKSKCLFL